MKMMVNVMLTIMFITITKRKNTTDTVALKTRNKKE